MSAYVFTTAARSVCAAPADATLRVTVTASPTIMAARTSFMTPSPRFTRRSLVSHRDLAEEFVIVQRPRPGGDAPLAEVGVPVLADQADGNVTLLVESVVDTRDEPVVRRPRLGGIGKT